MTRALVAIVTALSILALAACGSLQGFSAECQGSGGSSFDGGWLSSWCTAFAEAADAAPDAPVDAAPDATLDAGTDADAAGEAEASATCSPPALETVIDGDSISVLWPPYLRSIRTAGFIFPMAVSGSTCSSVTARVASWPARGAGRQRVALVWCGTNDLAGGATAAATCAAAATLVTAARAAGVQRVVMPNTIDRAWASPAIAAEAATFNADMLAGCSGADAVVDLAGRPEWAAGQAGTLPYYSDTIHPNGAGSQLLADTFEPVLLAQRAALGGAALDGGSATGATYCPPSPMRTVLVGDDTLLGTQTTGTAYANIYTSTWTTSLTQYLSPRGGLVVNSGVAGNTCAQMLTRATADAGAGAGWALQCVGQAKCTVFIGCGINGGGKTASQQWDDICSMASVARANGATRVVLQTLTDTSHTGTALATEQALSAMIRGCFASDAGPCACGDDLVDLAADPNIGAPGAHFDTRLFADGIRPTPTGHWYQAVNHFGPAHERALMAP